MRKLIPSFCHVVLCLTALCVPAQDVSTAEFQYFRSEQGIAKSAGPLPEDFNAPESLNWRVPLDGGHSTPIVDGGKIFVTTYRAASKELATVALDQTSGKVLWRNPIVPERVEETHPIGSPATATVACDGKHVYAFFGSAGMFCYDPN